MAERSIVDVGRFLQKYGLKIGEHPEFGGVTGGHAKGSYHYAPGGAAIDVTDWRPDVAPAYEGGKPIPWKQRTGELAWRAKQLGLFSEALGPGDKGHETHVHLALPDKKFITDQQLEWLATGRTKDPQGKLTDVMPGAVSTTAAAPATDQKQPGTITYNVFVPQQQEEKKQITPRELLSSFVEDYKQQRQSTAFTPGAMYSAMAQAATSPSSSLFGLG